MDAPYAPGPGVCEGEYMLERDAIENAGALGSGFCTEYAPGPGLDALTGVGFLPSEPNIAVADLVLVKECDGEYEPGAGAFRSSLDA